MSNCKMKHLDQKDIISRMPLQDTLNQNSQPQMSQNRELVDSILVNKNVVGKRRGRRKRKGARVEIQDITAENSMISSPSEEKSLAFPCRPGYGRLGSKCTVKANHFVAELSQRNLSQYNVLISPEVNSTRLNKAIMNQLVKSHGDTDMGNLLPVYDGRRALYTAGLLPFTSKEFIVTLAEDEECTGVTKFKTERTFTVRIMFVAQAQRYFKHNFLDACHFFF